jgi:hypothetical protein
MVATSRISRSAREFLRTFLLSLMVSVFVCLADTGTAPYLPPPLLGIRPEIRAQWETGGSATCNGRSLALTSINDGVCDCADGRCGAHWHELLAPLNLSAVTSLRLAHAQTPIFSAPTSVIKALLSPYQGSTVRAVECRRTWSNCDV